MHSSPQAILTLTAEECDGDECVSSFRLFCSAERRNMRISFKKCFFAFDIVFCHNMERHVVE